MTLKQLLKDNERLIDITTRELVRLSGKKAKNTKEYYTYINEALERVAEQSYEQGKKDIKEKILSNIDKKDWECFEQTKIKKDIKQIIEKI